MLGINRRVLEKILRDKMYNLVVSERMKLINVYAYLVTKVARWSLLHRDRVISICKRMLVMKLD